MIGFVKEFKGTLIVCAIIILCRAFGILDFHIVSGTSMNPNYKEGDLVLTSSVPSVSRLDVIIAKSDTPNMVIKRIIGMPNETIENRSDYLYVDGVTYDKDFVKSGACNNSELKKWQTGPEDYFIAGDNRCASKDSRSYGPVHKSQILGKVLLHLKTGDLLNKN